MIEFIGGVSPCLLEELKQFYCNEETKDVSEVVSTILKCAGLSNSPKVSVCMLDQEHCNLDMLHHGESEHSPHLVLGLLNNHCVLLTKVTDNKEEPRPVKKGTSGLLQGCVEVGDTRFLIQDRGMYPTGKYTSNREWIHSEEPDATDKFIFSVAELCGILNGQNQCVPIGMMSGLHRLGYFSHGKQQQQSPLKSKKNNSGELHNTFSVTASEANGTWK